MPLVIQKILFSQAMWLIVRCIIALLFISSGFAKLLDVKGSFAEMRAADLHPVWFFNYASALILLVGSYFILFDRHVWLGAMILSVFLFLTIVIVHQFWSLPAESAKLALYFALEHLAVIGGLIAMAMVSVYRQQFPSFGRGDK